MSTEQKFKKIPPSYIAELCPKGYVMRVEQIKQACLEALTVNVSPPELVKSYEAKMEQDAQRQRNEHSPLILTWSQRKTGRQVTHLVFDYAPKAAAKAVGKATKPLRSKKRNINGRRHNTVIPPFLILTRNRG